MQQTEIEWSKVYCGKLCRIQSSSFALKGLLRPLTRPHLLRLLSYTIHMRRFRLSLGFTMGTHSNEPLLYFNGFHAIIVAT